MNSLSCRRDGNGVLVTAAKKVPPQTREKKGDEKKADRERKETIIFMHGVYIIMTCKFLSIIM